MQQGKISVNPLVDRSSSNEARFSHTSLLSVRRYHKCPLLRVSSIERPYCRLRRGRYGLNLNYTLPTHLK